MSFRSTPKFNHYRGHELVTAPAIEPVSLVELKSQLELDADDTSKDTALALYITAAREMIEEYTGLALITQTWRMTLDNWPAYHVEWWDGVRQLPITELRRSGRQSDVFLPRYPAQEVDSITADGSSVTVTDVFVVDTAQRPARLVLKHGATWPTVLDSANGVVITYTAGYGDNAGDVPAALRLAIMQTAAYMFEHRGDCETGSALNMSGADSMLKAYVSRGL